MKCVSVNTKKYSKIVSEIEQFIETKRKKPKIIKGVVEKIDLSNKILTIKLQSTKHPDLSRGSLVKIRENSLLEVNIIAIVREIYHSTLKIEIKSDPSQFANKIVIIDVDKMNIILKRIEDIVKDIKKGNLSLDNIRILDFLIGKNKPEYNESKISFISKKINENQKEAVKKSIEAEDFHLIIGPPGTGKTYVLEELIRQFSKRKKKLLITAWTNRAVDNIIKRLIKKEPGEIVRIGPINEIEPSIKKYSIFEKMKKHKDWKEIEKYEDIINKFFDILPQIKEKERKAQKDIDQTQDEIRIFNKEWEDLIEKSHEFEKKVSGFEERDSLEDISPIINEIIQLSQKSEDYLSLSKDILLLKTIHSKIPKTEEIESLKKLIRKMKFDILKRKITPFLSTSSKQKLKELKERYEKNKGYQLEIRRLQKEYLNLKIKCDEKFCEIYPDKEGSSDGDALESEFEIYKILKEIYLPAFKKRDMQKGDVKTSIINKEVYKIYLASLKTQINLINIQVKDLRTDIYIQINKRDNLRKEYKNLLFSLDSYKKKRVKLMNSIISEILESADLIASTAISSCHYFLDAITFDVMMMDEASQVASFMSLLPLSKCKKFILVGDNKQLQPIEEEISKEMNLSLFNRLLDLYPSVSTLLTIQHRMHETIAQISNELFYEGKLETSEKIAKKILNLTKSKHHFLNPKLPAVFIDTSKAEYYDEEIGSGCSNVMEAEYIVDIVSSFIKKKIKRKDIGIVIPYVKQKLLIEKLLKDLKIKNVEVNTVHKFQGREKEIIIMGFVKSKKYSFPQYKLRFIEDEALVNVAITRAKKKLILVGNSKTLCQSTLLNRVIKKIGKENTVVL